MKRVNIDDLLKQNPDLNPDEVEEARRLMDRLRETGFEGAPYRLATPLSGKRMRQVGAASADTKHRHGRAFRRH
jgi:thiazole synthase ThiGH ThiG subunit